MEKILMMMLCAGLGPFTLAADNLFPPSFPAGTEAYQIELEEGWSRGRKVINPDYRLGWMSKKGSLELSMFMDYGEPVSGREQLERLLEEYGPEPLEVEWFTFRSYSDYLEEWMDSDIITYEYRDRYFAAWADFRVDYYPVLVIVSVPNEEYSSSRRSEMFDLIFKF